MNFQPHQQRVVDEKAELDDKRAKLSVFITENPLFHKLDRPEQGRLREQQDVMLHYSQILAERIEAFCA